jgi:hypothetical protein
VGLLRELRAQLVLDFFVNRPELVAPLVPILVGLNLVGFGITLFIPNRLKARELLAQFFELGSAVAR